MLIGQVDYHGQRIGERLHQSISGPRIQSVLAPITNALNLTLGAIGFPTAAQPPPAQDPLQKASVKESREKLIKLREERRKAFEELQK